VISRAWGCSSFSRVSEKGKTGVKEYENGAFSLCIMHQAER
jgi:hypothetical protein